MDGKGNSWSLPRLGLKPGSEMPRVVPYDVSDISEREAVMDEEIIEVMAQYIHLMEGGEGPEAWRALIDKGPFYEDAKGILAALRAEGFDIYRPGDCVTVEARAIWDGAGYQVQAPLPSPGTYRLVPAERGDQ